jgi:hypothetical protein
MEDAALGIEPQRIPNEFSVTFMYTIKFAHGHASPTIQSTSILAISTG